jgi:DNA polymerase sigma
MLFARGYSGLRRLVSRSSLNVCSLISPGFPPARSSGVLTACYATQSRKKGKKSKSKSNGANKGKQQHTYKFVASTVAASTALRGGKSQLHHELIDFAWRCAPTPASTKLAALSARAIELAWIRGGKGPPIKAVPFGSQPSAVALPGGDLDVYITAAEVRFLDYCGHNS